MDAGSDSEQLLADLNALESVINALLPPQYQFNSGKVNPRSMGSASLKYGPDLRVAWETIWTSFCDLAMAGGPPHRGALLQPPSPAEVRDEPAGYQLVTEEIARGVRLTTGMPAEPTAEPGWVKVCCGDDMTAAWLLRAVMAENVFVCRVGELLLVPAGPAFRLAKEIKNVIVAVAKTSHYWKCHLSAEQRHIAGDILQKADQEVLLPTSMHDMQPRFADFLATGERMAKDIGEIDRFAAIKSQPGWVGVRFPDEATAAWFVRAAIADQILARREEDILYLPVPLPARGEQHLEVVRRFGKHLRIWKSLQSST